MRACAPAVLLSIAGLCASGTAVAQAKADFGKMEYESKCASCHGVSGKGDGPLARGQLTKPPSSLTTLAKQNGGVFPWQRVYEIVDGRAEVAAHGPREMPVWGKEYRAGVPDIAVSDPSSVTFYDLRGTISHGKIVALVEYVYRIQEP
ncbi:MAG: c-type cytochrome [Burkholderiales bacterium]